jgi:hypothetical protein
MTDWHQSISPLKRSAKIALTADVQAVTTQKTLHCPYAEKPKRLFRNTRCAVRLLAVFAKTAVPVPE